MQNVLDEMEDQGINFEDEDHIFYSSGENELLKCLLSYVKDNKAYFQ